MKIRTVLSAVLFAGLLAGCAGIPTPDERKREAEAIASGAGLTPHAIRTAHFDLLSLTRGQENGGLLTVYIEGDGLAWRRSNERSDDPTPVDPVALKLAALDDARALAYLARPCQFSGGAEARNCTSDIWTSARYGEIVVSSMDEALDTLKQRMNASALALVGYSGGGAIVTLLAERRSDILWIKTISSPLDTEAFTSIHKVTPLSASLNPTDEASALASLPQIHYVGADDEIVPEEINQRFLARMGETRCAMLVTVPGMDHSSWADVWERLSTEKPVCR